jgi:shikimate dehydrogenase
VYSRLRGDDSPEPLLDIADTEVLAAALRKTDLLINATPVGMEDPDATPLDLALLRQLPSGACVFDMVYGSSDTALVRAARDMGLRASGGLPMLLHQGAAAFTLWTGRPAPLDAMRAALGLEAWASVE